MLLLCDNLKKFARDLLDLGSPDLPDFKVIDLNLLMDKAIKD